MSSGEASRFSAEETNQNGMPAHHSPERRGALHPQHHLSSPSSVVGGKFCLKHITRLCISCKMSALASLCHICRSPLLSEVASKVDHEANRDKKCGGVMTCMRVSQPNCDAGGKEVHTTTLQGGIRSPDFPQRSHTPKSEDPISPCSHLNDTSRDAEPRLEAAIYQFCICRFVTQEC